MRRLLEIKGRDFYLDGKPFTVISGTVHYFRTVPECWEDRLLKMKACGFNTVETYVPWNAHEPEKGRFDFSGILDIERFITLAEKLGLYVIVRPSPYICAEWEFGGLPYWLLKDRSADIRCADKKYLQAVEDYYAELLPKLVPHLSTNGGQIIAMQIENEYGSYGNDKEYLAFIRDSMRRHGVDILLFTSDGSDKMMLDGGTLPGIASVVNFGSDPDGNFANFEKFRPGAPYMCGEFWGGWFDHWGEPHHHRDGADAAKCIDRFFEINAGINVYTFHGGTNFGFMNGANAAGERAKNCEYQPTVTSYDNDSLLTEDGRITPKYEEVRKVLEKRLGKLPEVDLPSQPKRKAYGAVTFTASAPVYSLYGKVGSTVKAPGIKTMEDVGQAYGYINYRTTVKNYKNALITLNEVCDRAFIFVNGKFIKTVYRNDEDNTARADFDLEENTLDIFVENMGRINYGRFLKDRKGITEQVLVNYEIMSGWEIWSLSPEDIVSAGISGKDFGETAYPTVFDGTFGVDEVGDTFIKLPTLNRSAVWINGFCIGRTWNEKGPQQTLYVPAPLLKKGLNSVRIFETDPGKTPSAVLTDIPEL